MASDKPVLSDHDASGHLTSPFYGYLPSAPGSILFLLFIFTTVLNLVQATRTRTRAWWLLWTVVLAGIGEILGWAARTRSHYVPLDGNAYLMQTVVLIISPTPLIGALFITFGRMSARLGHQYSRLSPQLYSKVFITADIIALLIQSVGGGIAASSNDVKTGKLGSNIMLGGIVFQLISLTVFCVLLAEYLFRRFNDLPLGSKHYPVSNSSQPFSTSGSSWTPVERPMVQLAVGLCVEAVFLYIRAIYRTVELADGWTGKIIQTQYLFFLFDGVMVILTMIALNVCHPGRLLNTQVTTSEAVPLGSKLPMV
ncbi:RTA1 like protein-domain-containing protein [Trametes meyenii]|nr:RTA1 like protein-domain-containing protein [Trametes meyenii]